MATKRSNVTARKAVHAVNIRKPVGHQRKFCGARQLLLLVLAGDYDVYGRCGGAVATVQTVEHPPAVTSGEGKDSRICARIHT
jgi:hypothetical protein